MPVQNDPAKTITNPDQKTNAENQSQTALDRLCQKMLDERRLIIASNRGPLTYHRDEGGKLVSERGSGGVVTALSSLSNYTPISWVAAALSEADRELADAEENGKPLELETPPDPNLRVRFVNIDEDSFDKYLNVISNPLLWFVQHEMDELLDEETLNRRKLGQAWRQGYVKANEEFGRVVLQEADRPDAAPFVIFHDYQLYLAPEVVRQTRPDLTLMHFTHIPWPEAEAWYKLPAEWVRAICASLLDCDIVGMQTIKDATDFVQTCQEFLDGVKVQQTAEDIYQIEYKTPDRTRNTRVRAYPISIDPALVRQTYEETATQKWRARLSKFRPKDTQLIVRVDRLDPNKNILVGFEAYDHFLATHPEFLGKVNFLALMVPTRESVPEYAAYKKRAFNLIRKINRRYGTKDWRPIHYFYGNDYHRALAALSLADVVLVNSLADGMNLVAKEATIVNEQYGRLVLSRQAGAWEELGEHALGVEADDIEDTAQKLAEALNTPLDQRTEQAAHLQKTVEDNDLSNWLAAQLWDLGQACKVSKVHRF